MRFGSLFAGIGGFDLGLERAGMECAWQVEIDPWARRVLARHWPSVPRYEDVKEVGHHNLEPVDVICGGFPCQDISHAGKRAGIGGERSGLWGEYARIIRELRPRYVIVENVGALLVRGIDVVLRDLAESGYDAEWDIISAAAVGAPHLRERVWIVAYPDHGQRAGQAEEIRTGRDASHYGREDVAYPQSSRLQGSDQPVRDNGPQSGNWQSEPAGGSGGVAEMADTAGVRQQGQGESTDTSNQATDREGETSDALDVRIGHQWTVEPDVCLLADGLSEKLDGGRRVNVDKRWLQVPCPQGAGEILRRLREYREALRPPHQRGLDGQHTLELADAMQFLSYVIASQTGRHPEEVRTAAVQDLRQAVVSISGGLVQHTPDQTQETWESLAEEEKDWCIVASRMGPWWTEWTEVPRVASGIPKRVDRLRGLGNAVVPQVVEWIGRRIIERGAVGCSISP